MKEKPYKLPADLEKEYEIVGNQVVAHFPDFGLIDMRELTKSQAEDLITREFPYLKRKTTKKTKE